MLTQAEADQLKADIGALVDALTEGAPPPPPPPSGPRLVVEPGQVVTISADAGYPDGVEIKPGGKLVVADGVTLTVGKEILVAGEIEAVGQSRTRIRRVFGDLLQGQAAIDLTAVPVDWQVGDRLVIPDSRRIENTSGYVTHTEDRTITGISASRRTVFIDSPLSHDHPASRNPDGTISDRPLVANVTCSTTIQSDPANRCHFKAWWPNSVADPQPRGTLRNVAFLRMGRTTVDPVTDENGANPIGQYPLHLHHIAEAGANWTVEGCVIDGETELHKWGIVLHGTQGATVRGNVVRRMGGAGIVTEDASASGNLIEGNLSFDHRGNGNREDVNIAALQPGTGGLGYYLVGLNNAVTGNVAASQVNSGGFVLIGNSANPGNVLGTFAGNEAYCCKRALIPWFMGANFNSYIPSTPEQVIDGFRAWHVGESAWYGYPVANVTLRGFKVRGAVKAFDPLDYLHWNVRIVDPDWYCLIGMHAPMIVGHVSVDPSEQTFTVQGGTMRCTSGCIGVETPNGPSTGGATPRRTIVDGTLLDGDSYNIATSYNAAGQTTLPDAIEVRNYQGIAADNFGVYWTQNPNLPPPCTNTRPKIVGYCC